MLKAKDRFIRRKTRLRTLLRSQRNKRYRLSVYRSLKHIYAQIIDDIQGVTLVSASTVDKELRAVLPNLSNKSAAAEVGKLLALRAVAKLGSDDVNIVFDRGGYLFHGKVKALADAARENGLKF